MDFDGLEAGLVQLAAQGDDHLLEDLVGLLDFVLNADDGGGLARALFGKLAVADDDARVLVDFCGFEDRLAPGVDDRFAFWGVGLGGPGGKRPHLVDDLAAESEGVLAVLEVGDLAVGEVVSVVVRGGVGEVIHVREIGF